MERGLQMISQIVLLPHSKSLPYVCIALAFRNDLNGEPKENLGNSIVRIVIFEALTASRYPIIPALESCRYRAQSHSTILLLLLT